MSSESGVRTIIAMPDGAVAVHAASAKRQGAASLDALLACAEAKALAALPGARVAARLAVRDAPSDRRLRDAWRIDSRSGKMTVDVEAARELCAEQWAAEASELRAFIQARLLPKARLLGQRDAVERLNAALTQVERVSADLAARIWTMSVAELASHAPDWPKLGASA